MYKNNNNGIFDTMPVLTSSESFIKPRLDTTIYSLLGQKAYINIVNYSYGFKLSSLIN